MGSTLTSSVCENLGSLLASFFSGPKGFEIVDLEIILFAATWMDLEIIILSEVSQTDK